MTAGFAASSVHIPVELLHVGIAIGGGAQEGERSVGRLARRGPRIFFEHSAEFLAAPLPISPLHLPPRAGVLEETTRTFDGLHGVFADSLPDGWGRLLLDRALARSAVRASSLSPLDRLAFVGTRGMGALTFRPEAARIEVADAIDLAALARASLRVLDGDEDDVIAALLALGGSSGGARPKVIVGVGPRGKLVHDVDPLPPGFASFVVKFPNSTDPKDAGPLEQAFALMARRAGIEVPETRLFGGARGRPRFFGVRRFDRARGARVHAHTFAGMFHVDPRVPSLDAVGMLTGVRTVTRDERQVLEMYRRIAFNVLAHNRDDHPKNTSFLMARDGTWTLSPAYDLTFSSGPAGEHWTTVDGEGRAPGVAHLHRAAKTAGVRAADARRTIDEVRAAVADFAIVAREAGCSATSTKRIARALAP